MESDTSFHNATVLRMSDLSGEGEGGEVVVEQRGAESPYEEKIESLQTEVGALKAEVRSMVFCWNATNLHTFTPLY